MIFFKFVKKGAERSEDLNKFGFIPHSNFTSVIKTILVPNCNDSVSK